MSDILDGLSNTVGLLARPSKGRPEQAAGPKPKSRRQFAEFPTRFRRASPTACSTPTQWTGDRVASGRGELHHGFL